MNELTDFVKITEKKLFNNKTQESKKLYNDLIQNKPEHELKPQNRMRKDPAKYFSSIIASIVE